MFTSFMTDALAEAREAAARGEVPVGAVVVTSDGEIIGRGALCKRNIYYFLGYHPTNFHRDEIHGFDQLPKYY